LTDDQEERMSQPNTSEPTGVGAEVADEAAEVSSGDTGAPGATERAGERGKPEGATSDAPADDAGGGDVAGGAPTRDGEGLPGVATGTAGGNGIGGGEGSTSGPVDTEDAGTR
jgi:hypothetical protein